MLHYIEGLKESRGQSATFHIHHKKTFVHHEKTLTLSSSRKKDSDYHHLNSSTSKNGSKKVTLINAYESPPIEQTVDVSLARTYV